ncbi:hypothetical protein [Flavobacterium sp.]|uniref:hypothetical protein n=1 Tax=Flavobacterium sp. TaxID=239 RepID=UPI0039E37C4E
MDTTLQQRIEKALAAFPAKGRIHWQVDYEPLSIDTFEEKVKAIFTNYFDADYVEQNFALPEDFRIFLMLCPAPLQIPHEWEVLYDAQKILDHLPDYYNWYDQKLLWRRKHNENQKSDTMWLHFASWSDKHDYLIGCDRSSKTFGKVYDAYDDHPWMEDSELLNRRKSKSFVKFLEKW